MYSKFLYQARLQPDVKNVSHEYLVDQQRLARLVGYVALGLPVAMIVGGTTGRCFFDSISHFYYAPFWGTVLVGSLVFIGAFLLVYKGENTWENRLATIAGICACGIAIFPTSDRGCENSEFSARIFAALASESETGDVKVQTGRKFFELFSNVDILHFVCAGGLFLFLAIYTFFVFTREIRGEHRDEKNELKPAKRERNAFYNGCGWVIVTCIFAIALNALFGGEAENGKDAKWWNRNNAMFWCETIALWAFGLTWMVKGRALARWRDSRDHGPETVEG